MKNLTFFSGLLTIGLIFSLSCNTKLFAQVYSTVPYNTGFESGNLDSSWTTSSSLAGGEVDVFVSGALTWSNQTAYSHSGTYFMGMHYPGGGSLNLNRANLHLDLGGSGQLRLGFWWAEWNDELHPEDGVYISDDGGSTFTKVLSLDGSAYTDLTWHHFDMSLDSLNAAHGLNFTSTYIIRFQQYDDYYFAGGNDGFLFDDIEVYSLCNTVSTISPTVCNSYTVPSGNETYTASGTYHDTIPNTAGCDSIVTINLSVGDFIQNLTPTVCNAYTAPDGQVYTTSGQYSATFTTAGGCDSTYNIDLTVNHSSSATINPVACNSYVGPDGNVYTSGGQYSVTIQNSSGCDSNITMNLTITGPTSSTINPVACDVYTAPNGSNYTSSGQYSATLTNSNGCDSVISINLTVYDSDYSTVFMTACDSFTWSDGNTYTSTGTYTQNFTNVNGCDSIHTLNLSINASTSSTESQTACRSYTWTDGNTYSSSGTYSQTLSNSNGCDSTATLSLTIEQPPDMSISSPDGITLNAEGTATDFTWMKCYTYTYLTAGAATYTPSTNGNYLVVGTNASGCTDTSDCFVVNKVGLEERSNKAVTLYPTPVSDMVYLNTDEVIETVVVRDLSGKIVRETAEREIDVSELSSGLYFVSILLDDGTAVQKKFVKR